ncbi:MAG: hypothetical protein HYS98_08185, partial [Deltaproteobacteria bacterium]|nr:hypothetical protein [Deltaproteobacteria bacterium]
MTCVIIFILFHTPRNEIERLKQEFTGTHFNLVFFDVADKNMGYAAAINTQLKKKKADVYIIANPDISLKNIPQESLLAGSRIFDIWGFAMKQDGIIYYGGKIDKWRMS